jgi:competence protein ComEC
LHTTIHFINVGQGDATLVSTRGKHIFIDTGGNLTIDIATDVLLPYFKRLRIKTLEFVIISHDDFDHVGALSNLKQLISIKSILVDPFDPIMIGDVVLNNYQHHRHLYTDANDGSLIIGIQWHGCQVLIMGDASIETEARLLSDYPTLTAEILRVGHHGSNTSSSLTFLQTIKPKVGIISLGGANRYGHPHTEVLARFALLNIPVRRTDLEGTIRYQTCKI